MGCGASSALSHAEKRGDASQQEIDTLAEENSESKYVRNIECDVNVKIEGENNILHTSQAETVLTLSSNDLSPTATPQNVENGNSSNNNKPNNINNQNNNNNYNNANNVQGNAINDGSSTVADGAQFEPSSMSSFDRVQPLQTQSSNGNSDSISSKKEISFEEALAIVTQQLTQRQREGVSKVTKEEAERVVLMARELDNLKQMMRRSKYTVVGTWSIVENENMLGRFAQQLYDELLTANPRLRVYFYGVDLEEQSQTLLRMLSTAVRLYDKPQAMVDMLTKAGGRHRGYGVTKDTFVEMQNAFMKVFPKFIGEDVFSAAEDEWRKFWKLMLDLLEHGSVTAEGERYGKMYEQQNMKKLQNDFKLIVERQNKCDLRHQFVGIMYAKAIEMHGDLSKFDALKDLRASTRVFQAYVKIIKNLNDREWSQKFMHDLGVRHVEYGVTIENIKSFTEPFLFACRHFLEDEWNVAMESRFYAVFRYMIDGISSGITDAMENEKEKPRSSNTNTFCLMFTEIEGSSRLWQENSQAMSEAVKQHHSMIRRLITEYGAYEVKTMGDSFMIALKDIFLGAKLALAIQLELMRMAPIAPHFRMVENTEGRGDESAWNTHTLRLRIALEHCTNAVATYDTIHKRYDYYGLSVDRCNRIESVTCGGQILMSMESYDELTRMPEFHDEPCPSSLRALSVVGPSCKLDKSGLDNFVTVSDMGLVKLKGVRDPVHLVSLVPRCLDGREFVDKIGKLAQRIHE